MEAILDLHDHHIKNSLGSHSIGLSDLGFSVEGAVDVIVL